MKLKKITLVGYYGYDNLGDDIMLYCILKALLDRHNNLSINLLAKRSENLISIVSKFERVNFYEFKNKSPFNNFLLYLKCILESKLTIWGGGTCFSDEDGIGNLKYFRINNLIGRKFGYLGIGIGNILKKDSQKKTEWLLNRTEFAVFREEKSFTLAKNVSSNKNLYLSSDLSYLYTNEIDSRTIKKDYILLSLRDLSNFYSKKEIIHRHEIIMSFLIDYVSTRKINIKILPIDSIKDNDVNLIFYNTLKYKLESIGNNIEFIDETFFDSKIKLIQEASLNITERLHSIVMSKIFNTKCIGLSYSPKIDRFYKEIKDNNFITWQESISLEKLYEVEATCKNFDSNIFTKLKEEASKNIDLLEKHLG
ncbi:polysaccharide pyruvyl transferase family protein [Maribacter dokdonensis]|uniref:polysaccharide pyruvyl transferase family protein n=1 Tax=Maribacter dokdonensis TaxID=320912 RepID=UPI001C0A2667|nr:polysaccharide pyruvyl transferase family protein [Maribacter dokdonensis]MBU2900556.1 polysaccharide pyruvyl transferase family protein [Maribacter dokdonensis]